VRRLGHVEASSEDDIRGPGHSPGALWRIQITKGDPSCILRVRLQWPVGYHKSDKTLEARRDSREKGCFGHR